MSGITLTLYKVLLKGTVVEDTEYLQLFSFQTLHNGPEILGSFEGKRND